MATTAFFRLAVLPQLRAVAVAVKLVGDNRARGRHWDQIPGGVAVAVKLVGDNRSVSEWSSSRLVMGCGGREAGWRQPPSHRLYPTARIVVAVAVKLVGDNRSACLASSAVSRSVAVAVKLVGDNRERSDTAKAARIIVAVAVKLVGDNRQLPQRRQCSHGGVAVAVKLVGDNRVHRHPTREPRKWLRWP